MRSGTNDPPRQPEQNVATLVSRLRAALGSEVIIGGRGGYRFGVPPAVRVDMDTAAELVAEAGRRLGGGEPAFAVAAASRALEMLGTGSLLVGEPDTDWVAAARADAQRLVREARHTAAAAALLVDDPTTAVRVSAEAVEADRFDEAGAPAADDRASRGGGAVEGACRVRGVAGDAGCRAGCRPGAGDPGGAPGGAARATADARIAGPGCARSCPGRNGLRCPVGPPRWHGCARHGRQRPPAGQRWC